MSPAMIPAKSASGSTTNKNTPEYLEGCVSDALASVGKATFEPALMVSDFSDDVIDRLKPAAILSDDVYKTALETAHKNLMYDIALKRDPADEETIVAFCNLLDFGLVCAEIELANADLPLLMLEDIFDAMTIPSCEQLFRYLESRVERITAGMEGGRGKALVLLRLCNELLRRLSKAEDTIFCGRILIFLSKSFPISERSAVNLRGEFNTENVTTFDTSEVNEKNEEGEDTMDVDQGPEQKAEVGMKKDDVKSSKDDVSKSSSSQTPLSQPSPQRQAEEPTKTEKLYPIFWSLQHDFSNPTRLFEAQNFQAFKRGLAATMAKFKHADEQAMKASGTENGLSKRLEEKRTAHVGEKRKRDWDSENEGFNPKYLTSKDLFGLELNDLTFRRHVMVQAMILLDFLLSLTQNAKEKWNNLRSPNKSVQFAFTLGPEDEQWALKTKLQITENLQYDLPGRHFTRLINTCLSREQNWVLWKANGCHSFDMMPMPKEDLLAAQKKARDHCKSSRPFPHAMGTEALSKLWRESGHDVRIESLAEEDRIQIPTIDDFRVGIERDEESLKDALLDADIEQCNSAKQAKTWKALRLASQQRLPALLTLEDKFGEERNELVHLLESEERRNQELRSRSSQQNLTVLALSDAGRSPSKS